MKELRALHWKEGQERKTRTHWYTFTLRRHRQHCHHLPKCTGTEAPPIYNTNWYACARFVIRSFLPLHSLTTSRATVYCCPVILNFITAAPPENDNNNNNKTLIWKRKKTRRWALLSCAQSAVLERKQHGGIHSSAYKEDYSGDCLASILYFTHYESLNK